MSQESQRLRRLIEDEVGGCCDADVDTRLDELEGLTDAVPNRADADRTALGTLGDETRYRIVRLLDAADGELCVCEFSPLLDVSDSAISHALSDLTDSGLVEHRKDGKWRYYAPTERAERLVDALDATRVVEA